MPYSTPARSRHSTVAVLLTVATALMLSAATSPGASGRSKGEAAAPPPPEVVIPSDPYIAYLDEVASTSPSCKSQVSTVKELLNAQEKLTGEFASSSAGPAQEKAQRSLDELNAKLANAEAKLGECFETDYMGWSGELWSTDEEEAAPPAPPAPASPAATTTAATGEANAPSGKDGAAGDNAAATVTVSAEPPPPPTPPLPEATPAPAREAGYVEFLQARAGESTRAREYAGDIEEILAERRQLALRFLNAPEEKRTYLNAMIAALNQRVRYTADAIDEALELASIKAPAPDTGA